MYKRQEDEDEDGQRALDVKAKELLTNIIVRLGGKEGTRGFFSSFEIFANRLGNIPYAWQARLFDFFLETYRALVESAKADGTFNPGVQDISGLGARRVTYTGRVEVFRSAKHSAATTEIVSFDADYGVTFRGALALLRAQQRLSLIHI